MVGGKHCLCACPTSWPGTLHCRGHLAQDCWLDASDCDVRHQLAPCRCADVSLSSRRHLALVSCVAFENWAGGSTSCLNCRSAGFRGTTGDGMLRQGMPSWCSDWRYSISSAGWRTLTKGQGYVDSTPDSISQLPPGGWLTSHRSCGVFRRGVRGPRALPMTRDSEL